MRSIVARWMLVAIRSSSLFVLSPDWLKQGELKWLTTWTFTKKINEAIRAIQDKFTPRIAALQAGIDPIKAPTEGGNVGLCKQYEIC